MLVNTSIFSTIKVRNGRYFVGKWTQMPSKRNWWKSKKPLNTCYYGTCYMYLKNHQFCPERMNIHTGMSHAKCQMNKDSKKDQSVSLLFSFSQEFTTLVEPDTMCNLFKSYVMRLCKGYVKGAYGSYRGLIQRLCYAYVSSIYFRGKHYVFASRMEP